MMESYTVYEQMEWVNELIKWTVYIVLPALVGSYASDYFKTLKQEEMRISFRRVILASAIAVAISFIFLDRLMLADRRAILPIISLVLGLIGFELLHGLSSIDNMVALLRKISTLLSPILTLIRQVNEVRTLAATQKQNENHETLGKGKDKDSEGGT